MTPSTRSDWFKSTHSMQNGDCVEVRYASEDIAVRDSKRPGGAQLHLSPAAWAAFVSRLGSRDRA